MTLTSLDSQLFENRSNFTHGPLSFVFPDQRRLICLHLTHNYLRIVPRSYTGSYIIGGGNEQNLPASLLSVRTDMVAKRMFHAVKPPDLLNCVFAFNPDYRLPRTHMEVRLKLGKPRFQIADEVTKDMSKELNVYNISSCPAAGFRLCLLLNLTTVMISHYHATNIKS